MVNSTYLVPLLQYNQCEKCCGPMAWLCYEHTQLFLSEHVSKKKNYIEYGRETKELANNNIRIQME